MLDWYNLGTKLGLPDYKLREIRLDYTETVQKRQEVISKWLAYDTEASWNKLARAVKKMHVVDKEVLDKHESGYEGRFAWNQHILLQKVQIKECCEITDHSIVHNYIMTRATSTTALTNVWMSNLLLCSYSLNQSESGLVDPMQCMVWYCNFCKKKVHPFF